MIGSEGSILWESEVDGITTGRRMKSTFGAENLKETGHIENLGLDLRSVLYKTVHSKRNIAARLRINCCHAKANIIT